MAEDGQPELAIESFARLYELLCCGTDVLIAEKDIMPLTSDDVIGYDSLPEVPRQLSLLNQVAVIKLNGGLGTTMGLEIPKAAIEAKQGWSFLDLTAKQVIRLRVEYGVAIPLILMTSFNTHERTTRLLEPYRHDLASKVPLVFLQHRFPKVIASTLEPAVWPRNSRLEWNPPGHGDLYAALITSGMLDAMIDSGIRYAVVSNIDNLGAVLDLRILNYFALCGATLLMEITIRHAGDTKGGHIARRYDGRFVLREEVQCPRDDVAFFRDITRYCYFNTNTLWFDLVALKTLLSSYRGLLPLPAIKNEKHLDPCDTNSQRVYQLETAMGAIINLVERPCLLVVERSRFLPVKKCSDLLILWSDRYSLTDEWEIVAAPHSFGRHLVVDLDKRTFGSVDQLRSRFPHGIPSLVECDSLTVRGDVVFGRNVRLKGRIVIVNSASKPLIVPHNAILENEEYGQ